MGRETGFLFGFNAGIVSEEALQRVDQSATRVAGEVQENILPRKLGAGVFRPGTEFKTACLNNDSEVLIPFIFSATDTALIELTRDGEMRVLIDGAPVTRASVSTSIANPTFGASLASWTDDDETGGSSTFSGGGHMSLEGNGSARARRYQSVTVSGGDQNTEHALRVVVNRGPVYFAVGTTSSNDDIVREQVLGQGHHSLAFTPGASPIYVSFAWDGTKPALVESCDIESAGDMVLPTPWNTVNRVREVQYAQSADVVYCAQARSSQRKIERRSSTSWSIVEYLPEDGPFRVQNAGSILLTPAATTGSFQVAASRPLFDAGHVGSLWRLTHNSARYDLGISAEETFTEPVRVSGIEDERGFTVIISSAGSNTVTLQRAFGVPVAFEDYQELADGTHEIDDGRDNEIIYYRVGIATGDYVSGTTNVSIRYSNASQSGVVRVRSYVSPILVTVDAITQLGATDATRVWNAPEWSDYDGWPSAVALFDGRLWWGGSKVFASVSDAYESFDDQLEGDAGPIVRSIAVGPFETVLWLQPMQRLLAGTATNEVSIQSSGFDEPVTPTDFTARVRSRRGSATQIAAITTDSAVIFVQRNRRRIYALTYSVETQGYSPTDLTRLAPEVCGADVVSVAVQQEPDTRVWFVLTNGTAVCLLFEPDDSAIAFVRVTTIGDYKAVAVLPSEDSEDEVYFIVDRGGTRVIEKMAHLDEVRGATLSKNSDSHVVYQGSATTTISGLDHLIGEDVVVWADGEPVNDQDDMLTVNGSGEITLASAASNVVAGLPYNGRFHSAYLDYGARLGVALGKPQKLVDPRLIAIHLGWNGVELGTNFTTMRKLAPTYNGRELDPLETLDKFVQDVNFLGGWERGARFAIRVKAPYPATFLGIAVDVETGEGVGD